MNKTPLYFLFLSLSLFILGILFQGCNKLNVLQKGVNYYLDSENGADSNNGLSPATAWKSINKIKDIQFNPGDSLLLCRGSVFEGVIDIFAHGKPENRIVIDAYGLFALSKFPEKISDKKVILTPHSMEMARLVGVDAETVEKNRFELSKEFSEKYNVTLVLKGNHSIITAPDGRQNINMTGNSGMATAGSGDVLAGIVASLLAICEPYDAATLAVHFHGKAGDFAKENLTETAVMAGDIIAGLPHILPVENTK